MIPMDVFVGIPVSPRKPIVIARPNLDKPNPALQQPPGNQTFSSEVIGFLQFIDLLRKGGLPVIQSIQFQDVLGLVSKINGIGSTELHPCGQFVGPDSCLQPLVPFSQLAMFLIGFFQQAEAVGFALWGHKGVGWGM